MTKLTTITITTIGLVALLSATPSVAQNDNAKKVITLLLDGDVCIKALNVGDVVFDILDPKCLSQTREPGTFAQ